MLNAVPRLLYFQARNVFTGDHRGMRMRMTAAEGADGAVCLRAWVWPEPACFAAAAPQEVLQADFPLDEEGLTQAKNWFCTQYDEQRPRWDAAFTPPRP